VRRSRFDIVGRAVQKAGRWMPMPLMQAERGGF